ncbi:MAG TPA: PadR family transcriptional regulator [Gemmatimonadaceae bacterium]|jgi:DNA-binding PadR family transcriptional regulator|nr:PadR family transcriptional regulator [Gemmatimonadaceae bacterium]
MPRSAGVTLADLVVLSMLAERPLHGYELWAELERRQVAKWASITRAQVYYSLRKLDAAGHIVSSRADDESLGPERRVYRPGEGGRRLLADALARARWATQRPPDPFLTWMVLSWQARPRDFQAQIARRRRFVEGQIADDTAALAAVIQETSPTSDAALVVRLSIRQFETELAWLDEVEARQRPG